MRISFDTDGKADKRKTGRSLLRSLRAELVSPACARRGFW